MAQWLELSQVEARSLEFSTVGYRTQSTKPLPAASQGTQQQDGNGSTVGTQIQAL